MEVDDSAKKHRRSRSLLPWLSSQQYLINCKDSDFAASKPRIKRALIVIAVLLSFFVVSKRVWSHVNKQTLLDRGVLRFHVPDYVFEQAEAVKAIMPRSPLFQNMTAQQMHQQLPVWIISLARATARREHMQKQIEAAGLTNYDFVDAADYRNASSYTEAELKKYVKDWRLYMWNKNQSLIRSKIAIDLSHFRLLERIVSTGRPAVILEDDAQIDMMGRNWLPNLLTALQELPQDWDILYFNAIFTTRGNRVSPHLIAIRGTASAIGYIATPAFAAKVLDNARSPWYNAWVDIIFELMERHREAQAYLVEPPLVQYAPLGTTNAIDAPPIRYSWWEYLRYAKARQRKRLLRRHLRLL